MVPIKHNQRLADKSEFRVFSEGKDYADIDLILCAPKDTPDTPTIMVQAQFVAYGPLVYQFNTPEDLGAAIMAVDPDSKHDAVALYKEQVARDAARNAGTLEPGTPVEVPEDPELEEVPEEDEPFDEEVTPPATDTSTTTPQAPSAPSIDNSLFPPNESPFSTTTPPTGTTTPSDPGISTTTPPLIHDIIATSSPDISTTTTE